MKNRIESVKKDVRSNIDSLVSELKIDIVSDDELLVESSAIFPVYMIKGDAFFLDAQWETGGDIKIYNSESKQLVKSYIAKKKVNESLSVPNSAIYLIQVSCKKPQYLDVYAYYKIGNLDRLGKVKSVRSEEQPCKKSDFMAYPITAIKTINIFENPRKFTLRGQLKAMFSGSARALVAVTVPQGATDILYSLRISTSEQDKSSDGKFNNNLVTSYRKIKTLGLPIYESSTSNGILNMILDDNRPLVEEDAYCNMYVFRKSADAKKFQDASSGVSGLDYDLDYSTLGTQSCDGRVPVGKCKQVYFAFENERMRYSNYIWFEATAVVPVTEYYCLRYTVD